MEWQEIAGLIAIGIYFVFIFTIARCIPFDKEEEQIYNNSKKERMK